MTRTKVWVAIVVIALVAGAVAFAIWKLDKLDIIDRRAFDWASFAALMGALATLLTGLAAIAGALWIGARQVEISERQTAIQDRQAQILARQVSLQELTLNAELYDKRVAVYNATADYLNGTLLNGRSPDVEIKNQFHDALASSRFIFRNDVHETMRRIYALSMKFDVLDRRIQRAEDADDPALQEKAVREKQDAFDELAEHQRTLPQTFSELRLVIASTDPAA